MLTVAWWYFILCLLVFPGSVSGFTESEVRALQESVGEKPLGERIGFWAERFVGTAYDPDPLGEYVTRNVLVADERVDCMYLSFRVLELASSTTPEEALAVALEKRFRTRGIVKEGHVENYGERFEYGEDMLDSGKWGREITRDIAPVSSISGARGRDRVEMIPREAIRTLLRAEERSSPRLETGDFLYFVKSPEKRVSGEIVGHIGIVKRVGDTLFLIHAGGRKNGGGSVKKVPLRDYIDSMPFVGIRVGRVD